MKYVKAILEKITENDHDWQFKLIHCIILYLLTDSLHKVMMLTFGLSTHIIKNIALTIQIMFQ